MAFIEITMEVPQKLKRELTCYTAMPFLSVYPQDFTSDHRDTFVPMSSFQ